MSAVAAGGQAGPLLREWRRRRRLSQLDLSLTAAVSARHLSFVETGRSKPSRELLLHLAERLEVPLRERNRLLLAGGYAPAYSERSLDDPELEPVRQALERFLAAHEPYPAVIVDRHWNLVLANSSLALLTEGVAPELLAPPANALRATFHPDGLAPRIRNLPEWSAHVVHRLRRELALTGDPELEALLEELLGYPGVAADPPAADAAAAAEIVLRLELEGPRGPLAFFSTLTTFGTAADVTLAELAVEAFYPADETTAAALRP